MQLIGVGYRAAVSGSKLTLNLGYSNPVEFDIPKGLSCSVRPAPLPRLLCCKSFHNTVGSVVKTGVPTVCAACRATSCLGQPVGWQCAMHSLPSAGRAQLARPALPCFATPKTHEQVEYLVSPITR